MFAWEQRKLGEITDVRDGTHASPHYVNSGFPLLTSKNISNGCINYNEVNYISEYDFHQINERSKVDVNDILMGMIGTIGNLALVQEKTNFAIKNVALIKNTGSIDHRFLFQDLQTDYIERELSNNMDGGTQKFISLKKIRNLSITFPTLLNEQDKIGNLFHFLDSTITLHEEKKHQLESLKSALLQKMFANKNGYPAVRFEGFSNEWEHCKLGDVADITTGSRNHQDSVTDGKYPFFVRSDKVERLNEYDFDTKAILVPGDGRIGEIFHYYNGKFALHQRVYKVDNFNGINELFLLGLFKYSFKEHALRLNAQGTVPSLRLPMFTNWSISVPMITEQKRIGVFFQKLEQTISLYDHKLELLKKVKRSMLQAMFI
ncbi:MAG: restriction endonuclease subunit S [Lactobacillus delbrueckii]|uniref:restriction endonuclease subunit S n=1 Tax=Lactobacillus delbrueckii TaxID=1584 RepID=UPI00237A6AB0|nr:restriction endonuclease subunit S [Lactobacillus delbrueckii]MDK8308449.1 restriction endonuclease subunit S [Lactobacillus delbrueckii]